MCVLYGFCFPCQWYVHLRRAEGADLGGIKKEIQAIRDNCASQNINLVVGMGPSLLKDLTDDVPDDFQNYETFKSIDGSEREAKDQCNSLSLSQKAK